MSIKSDDKLFLNSTGKDPSSFNEISRSTLEKNAHLLQRQMDKAAKAQFKEACRFVSESSCLITELNYLKGQYRSVLRRLKKLEDADSLKELGPHVQSTDNVLLAGKSIIYLIITFSFTS
jgi:hypothetical protein